MGKVIYVIGLIIAIGFIFFSIDDLIWDFVYFVTFWRRGKGIQKLRFEDLDSVPPKLLAVIIAAWHEENVLEKVVDHFILTTHYPQSMYHIFIGVYPNDPETIDVARKLEKKYENVHVVINKVNGPTTKAQNLNSVLSNIRQFEQSHNWRFSSFTMHDSEDVVHPYELRVTNYLIDTYPLLQFPVFPIQRIPTIKNFFHGMTSGTYADEFAENHFRVMRMRDFMHVVVPSAGTGFVISHSILDYYGNKPLFPEDSLTEDYKLSVQLALEGYYMHYVLESVPRLLDNGKVRWDYVATRSLFPSTFKSAVKQKTRWIYGITMQSVDFRKILALNRKRTSLSFKYSLYKDLKTKFGYLLILPGYLIFAYFIVSLFIPLPIMYPWWTLAGWLSLILTIITIYRQILRAIAIQKIYGFRSVVAACLIPPFIPLRLFWGNIINFSATLGAWKKFWSANSRADTKQHKVVWSKTDHEFLSDETLKNYYRKTGDVLLERRYIDIPTLRKALMKSQSEGKYLGAVLLEEHIINEEQLMNAMSELYHKIFVKNVALFKSDLLKDFDERILNQALFYPLLKVDDGYVIAATEVIPEGALDDMISSGTKIYITYTTKERVLNAISAPQSCCSSILDTVNMLLKAGKITWEQAVIAVDNSLSMPDILEYMGINIAYK